MGWWGGASFIEIKFYNSDFMTYRSLSDISSDDLRNFNYGGNAQSVTNLITSRLNSTFNGVSVSQ